MSYVDGFVLPVARRRIEAYRRMARKAGKIWREHGALEYRECIADDVPFDAKRMICGGFKVMVEY